MSGMTGVEVKTGVGDRVADEVRWRQRGSGVGVSPAQRNACQSRLRRAGDHGRYNGGPRIKILRRGGRLGTTHAREAINKRATDKRSNPVDKRTGVGLRMKCLLSVIKSDHTPKRRN
jgi:hypothetical protein